MPRSANSSSRGRMSSPVITPILSLPPSPSSRAVSRIASAQPSTLTPPAFESTLMSFSTQSGSISRISETKSRA